MSLDNCSQSSCLDREAAVTEVNVSARIGAPDGGLGERQRLLESAGSGVSGKANARNQPLLPLMACHRIIKPLQEKIYTCLRK